jgi:hypothetical protein
VFEVYTFKWRQKWGLDNVSPIVNAVRESEKFVFLWHIFILEVF